MPNRVIRDALLDSERYHAIDKPARLAFFELLLCADDYGLLPLSDVYLKRHTTAFEGVSPAVITSMLSSLADQDLLRIYDHEGAKFGFLPRFGNNPRAAKPKWPTPPESLTGNKINDLASKLHSKRIARASQLRANAPETETETETETGTEKTPPASQARRRGKPADPSALPPCPYEAIVALYHAKLPTLPAVRLMEGKAGEKRKAAMRTMWSFVLTSKLNDKPRATNSAEALAWIGRYFDRATENDFLMGRTKRTDAHGNWRPDLEFLLGPKGMVQVIEKTEAAA